MGLFDRIRDALGSGADAGGTDREALLRMEGAGETMATDLGYEPTGQAALCLSDVNSARFRSAADEVRRTIGADADASIATVHTDDRGFGWVVLESEAFEDLVVGIPAATDAFVEGEYGDRLFAAVFEFDRDGERSYWIYSFGRQAFYPFAPRGERERDEGAERELRDALEDEIGVEPDEAQWHPLWPGRPGAAPWVTGAATAGRRDGPQPGQRRRRR